MDFKTLSRRQLQALCKKNKIPANITNLAMADSLHALHFVEGIEEIMNSSETEIAQSPMVPPTGGRSRAVKVVGVVETPRAAPATATRRRAAAAASTSVRRKIEVSSNESLDEVEEVKMDVSVKTPAAAPASRRRAVRETSTVKPVYSTRRSTRLAVKIEERKETSEAIKIHSFAEDIDESVEVEMEGGSVDQSENSEITVLDNFKEECSEENEVKSKDESEAISEETSDNPNLGDVTVAIIEQTTSSDIKTDIEQDEENVNGLMEVSENIEDTKMYSSVAQETKASIEDSEMNSNEDVEVKASFEVADTISNVDEEAKTVLEDIEMNCNVDEETKASIKNTGIINSNVDDEPKASFEDIEMKTNFNEEPKVSFEDTEIKTNVDAAVGMNSKEEGEINIAESKGHMVPNVNVDCQKEMSEDPSEIETSSDEDSDMSDDDCKEMFLPEVEIQDDQRNDELVDDKDNLESNFSDGGDVHIEPLKKCLNKTPMENSAAKTPKIVGRLIQSSDGKENVDSGRKSILVKEVKKKPFEDCSIRQLIKEIKKLEISKQQKKEDGKKEETMKATTTRPALKTLSENMMVVESHD